MDIKRFFACVVSVETGRKEIKNLIFDIKKAEKEVHWPTTKDITVDLTGVFYKRSMRFENIKNVKLVDDQLKINYSANVHDDGNSAKVSAKDTTIGIPINLISSITLEVK